RTRKPASEGVVAGLEPFIDTIVVCTITALVILSSGVWERGPAATLEQPPAFTQTESGQWVPDVETLPAQAAVDEGGQIFLVVRTGQDGEALERLYAEVGDGKRLLWQGLTAPDAPSVRDLGLYLDLPAAALTAAAFDSAADGLGQWMVTIAVWLFALSTMITWSYYAEQGVVYLAGERPVLAFRLVWCLLIVVATVGIVRTDAELDTLSTVAIGFMLAINLPLMLLLAHKAIAAQRSYFDDIKQEGPSP
ncbi:MAG: alanine:cation symporter family protein, partial [Algiphilus sp.]